MHHNMAIFVACCLGAGTVSAAPLVNNGKPTGEFVLPVTPAGAESFATQDVRDWIQKITGADVPIVSAPSELANTKIFVGSTRQRKHPTPYPIRNNGREAIMSSFGCLAAGPAQYSHSTLAVSNTTPRILTTVGIPTGT